MYHTLKNIKFVFLFLFSLLKYDIYYAQTTKPYLPVNVRHISSNEGLSQVSVRTIIKDKKGFVWLGTIDGLNRFDGTNIIQFYHHPKDKTSLCGNFINTLLEDKKGRIWVGTSNHGFCYYKPEKGIFIQPETNKQIAKSLKASIVTKIVMDKHGSIWISANSDKNNINLLRIKEKSDEHFEIKPVKVSSKEINISSLYISKNDKIWVGTDKGEIFFADISNNDKTPDFQPLKKSNITGRVNSFIDDEKAIWVGTNEGFWKIDKTSTKTTLFDLNTSKNIKTRKYFVYNLAFTSPNDLWVAAGNGLYLLKRDDMNKPFIKTKLFQQENKGIISHNTVYSLLVDENFLWIGTAKNLDIFDFNPPKFQNITDKLSNKIVLSVFKNNRDLWIGTAGGLNLIRDEKVFLFKENNKNPNSISDDIIKSIVSDKKGHLWFGSTKGIFFINTKTFNPEKPIFTTIQSSKNENENVTQIFLDKKGQIWITTKTEGIKRFTGNLSKKDYSFQAFKHQADNPNTISSNTVFVINQDNNGNYWVGTLNGLDKISFLTDDFKQFRIKKYKHQDDNIKSISTNSIKNIYFDKKGIMWVGTRFGLNKFNKNDDSFQSFYVSDGLPNDLIYAIQEDDFDNLWLGTNKGLACFNKKNENFINYFVRNGISNNEFNSLANFKDKNGKIYMGNVGGLTYFYPPNVLTTDTKQKVLITEILIPEQIKKKVKRKMKRFYPFSENHIQLKYNEFPMFVKFASPQSGPFNEPDFYYKLLPVDQEWNDLEGRKELQLLNLSPDKYTLLVTGGQNGKIWEQKASKLYFEVTPPWWNSIWAYALYSLLFLSIIFSFYYFSLKRKLEHQENLRLTELDELKTKLFNNITHELRTPLTVIMGMTENIINGLSKDQLKKFKTKFDILSKNNKKLLFLINQMLDLSKIENGKMQLNLVQDDIIPYIKINLDSFHSLAKNKKVNLIFYDEIKSLMMDFDPEKITIILSNLISNAIKFTNENGKIILHVNKIVQDKSYLILKIKDNGIGISKEDQQHIFDRFYQAETHSLTDGTGIGLALTKEVITLMNGNISVESELDKGTEFIVKIPISNKAKIKKITPQPLLKFDETNTDPKLQTILDYKDDLPLILIVEDNKDVAHFIASCLENDYNIMYAYDGQEGINTAFEKIPDIIITDLMMPKTDGLTLTKTLKDDIRTSHIPIIMLTARSLEEDKLAGLKQGADAYLIKPFNKKELTIRVEQLILLRERLQLAYASEISEKTIHKKINDREAGFINEIVEIIESNLSNTQLNSGYIAQQMALSESQLYRKLKAITGKSTAIFIRSIRLLEAKKQLQTTDKNISEIAYDCGFNEASWFSKVFKDEFGLSPSEVKDL